MIKPAMAVLAIALLLPLAACKREDAQRELAQPESAVANPVFLADNAIWREVRKQDLLRPDGWAAFRPSCAAQGQHFCAKACDS